MDETRAVSASHDDGDGGGDEVRAQADPIEDLAGPARPDYQPDSTAVISEPHSTSALASNLAPDATPTAAAGPTTTTAASGGIEGELNNVMAGIGSFWGRVRKQSAVALQQAEKQMETARKDLTPFMEKARANLDSISESTRAEFARLSEQSTTTGVVIGPDGFPVLMDPSPAPSPPPRQLSSAATTRRDDKGKGVDPSERGDQASIAAQESTPASDTAKLASEQAAKASATASAFFAKLQSQVASNPNVRGLSKNLATLQHQVQNNLQQLPTSLQTNLHQLQEQFAHIDLNESGKAAEAYLTKGEHWLQEFSHEVGRLALETVKVVPPNEADMADARTKRREERLKKAEEVAVGRRDLLVWKFRSDKDALLVDPAQPPPMSNDQTNADGPSLSSVTADTREAFSKFLQSVEDRGGFEGSAWTDQVERELEAGGIKLRETFDALVPASMSREAFWSRYFFRVAQIDEDEQRRRQVLETEINDDDFSWDMDDEDESQAAASQAASPRLRPATSSAAAANLTVTGTTPGSETTPRGPTSPPTLARNDSSSASSDADWGFSPDPRDDTAASGMGHFDQEGGSRTRARGTPAVAAASDDTAAKDGSAANTASPRASSDGTSSYDLVGERSGAPSERDHDEAPTTAATTFAVGPRAVAEGGDSSDSDWE